MILQHKCYCCVSPCPILFMGVERSQFISGFDSSCSLFWLSGMSPAAEGDEHSGGRILYSEAAPQGVHNYGRQVWGDLESLSVGQGLKDGIQGAGKIVIFCRPVGTLPRPAQHCWACRRFDSAKSSSVKGKLGTGFGEGLFEKICFILH